MLPAQQSLDPDHRHVRQVEDRLVVQEELVGADRRLQIHLELVAAVHGVVHLGLEEHVAVLAGLLGRVQGHVGVAEQLFGSCPARPARDADGGRDRQRVSFSPPRWNGSASTSRRRSATSSGPAASEMPSARTTNSSPPRRATVSDSRSVPENRAATERRSSSPTLWPSVVVDILEAVEVDEQQRHVEMVPAGPGHGLLHPVEDEGPVGQPGQAVVQGLVADLFEQPGVVDGDGGLAGQTPQPLGDVRVVVEPLGVRGDVDGDPAEQLAVGRDGQASEPPPSRRRGKTALMPPAGACTGWR